jgi:hypothetical protein
MSQNNQTRNVAYDNATAVARQAAQLLVNTAGAASISGSKFYAWASLVVWGVTFATVAPGTSTYTVSGSATSPATQVSALYITNTNTTGTAVSLGTTTVGPFTIGGTSTAGTNAPVGGQGGGLAGGYQGPYALNTLGGTNTSQVWGTNTYIAAPGTATGAQTQVGYPGGQNLGLGGLPMNPGDVLYFVNGTDTTATFVPIIQYSVAPGPGPGLGGIAPIGQSPGNIVA